MNAPVSLSMQSILAAVAAVHQNIITAVNDPQIAVSVNGMSAYDAKTDTLKVKVSKGAKVSSFRIPGFVERYNNGLLDSDYYKSAAYHIDYILENAQ